ncbi:hypothetical protein FA13DRAFT_1711306 [Coprinellus micaceus]|uniref:Uncharacterized protein n=1 Tax=Coprinellus micaceus TaxID=71717 RepID=A0A4Y7T6Y7_COPMI|nr:hypothetical protein FA13DRAFT_1711306 [Coprinellus micaceus]
MTSFTLILQRHFKGAPHLIDGKWEGRVRGSGGCDPRARPARTSPISAPEEKARGSGTGAARLEAATLGQRRRGRRPYAQEKARGGGTGAARLEAATLGQRRRGRRPYARAEGWAGARRELRSTAREEAPEGSRVDLRQGLRMRDSGGRGGLWPFDCPPLSGVSAAPGLEPSILPLQSDPDCQIDQKGRVLERRSSLLPGEAEATAWVGAVAVERKGVGQLNDASECHGHANRNRK